MSNSYLSINDTAPELAAQNLINSKRKNKFEVAAIDKIKDEDWLKQSFLIYSPAVTDTEKINRTFSSAKFKFQDSSLGGHYIINPRAQFTRYADVPVKGFLSSRTDLTSKNDHKNAGLGHYYSEAIDDTSQVIHMRFGVPQFNSMTTFFTGFFDNSSATMARTGRISEGFFNSLGSAIGFITYLVTWPLVLASLIGNAVRFGMQKPSSSFYYFKPTMPIYWTAVSNMVNQIAITKGMFPGELDANSSQFAGTNYKIDAAAMANIASAMPDIFSKNGGINVFAMATRGQRMKNKLDKELNESYQGNDGFVEKYDGETPRVSPGDRGVIENFLNNVLSSETPLQELAAYVKGWANTDPGKKAEDKKAVDFERSLKVNTDGTPKTEDPSFANFMSAELDDGAAFTSFRVNSTGPMSESFSNNIVDSDLGSKFNSTSASNKAAYFASAGGNIVGGGAIGDLAQGAAAAVVDIGKGIMDSLNIGGLLALGGSAFTIIPKNWENSIASLPKSTYTINLVSPYGNVISQMTNIYIPLCMLLTGCLPLSAGKQAYTSPFLVQLYDRGRQQTRLGIIDSMSITRGTSNLGFNKEGAALRIDVSFSVADLTNVIAMPIASKTFLSELNPLDGVMDDDNIYSDYINVLSALGMYDQIYSSAKLRIRLANRISKYDQFFNKARLAMFTRDLAAVGMLDVFFKGAQRDNAPSLRSGLFGDKAPL